MAVCYGPNKLGTIKIWQEIEGKKHYFNIEMRRGNCLAVMIYIRKATPEELEKDPSCKKYANLYSFFGNEQHIKNIMKDNDGKCLWDEVKSIRLNMFFEESKKLLKYFLKSGYEVTCYYKEEKIKGW